MLCCVRLIFLGCCCCCCLLVQSPPHVGRTGSILLFLLLLRTSSSPQPSDPQTRSFSRTHHRIPASVLTCKWWLLFCDFSSTCRSVRFWARGPERAHGAHQQQRMRRVGPEPDRGGRVGVVRGLSLFIIIIIVVYVLTRSDGSFSRLESNLLLAVYSGLTSCSVEYFE